MGSFARLLSIVMVMLAMTACSKSPSSEVSQHVTTSSAGGAATPFIDLRPLTISFQGQTIARLFADGRTESSGPNAPGTVLLPGPTIHADGTIALTKGGATARIDGKGDVYVTEAAGANPREELFGRISGDQFTFVGSDRPWSVRVHGNLIEFSEDNSAQIDGDVTPSARRTALIMAAAFYIEGALAPTAP